MMMSSLTHVNSACGYMFHIPPNGYCTHTDIGHHQVIGHQTLTPGLHVGSSHGINHKLLLPTFLYTYTQLQPNKLSVPSMLFVVHEDDNKVILRYTQSHIAHPHAL